MSGYVSLIKGKVFNSACMSGKASSKRRHLGQILKLPRGLTSQTCKMRTYPVEEENMASL